MRISYIGRTACVVVVLCSYLSLGGCTGLPFALARYPTHPQAEAAVGRLLSSDATLISEAKREISILGDGAMPVLYKSMDSANAVGRVRIIESASLIGTPPELAARVIEKGAEDEAPNVRQSAAFHAGRFPHLSEQLGPVLIELAKDTNPQVRAAALSSLGGYPVTAQLPAEDLAELTRDSNVVVAASAASLAIKRPEPRLQIAARDALPILVGKLQDPVPANRAAVLFAIGHYGKLAEPTIAPLTKTLQRDKVPEVRLQAAIALMKINTHASRKVAVPALKSFTGNPDPRLSGAAQSALSALPSVARK
jgi:HEAT repeat protein